MGMNQPQKPEPNKDRIALWVEALRGGEYLQGQAQLVTFEGKYCCLGVAVEVALKNGYEPQTTCNSYGATLTEGYDVNNSVLWPGVQDWYGLRADPVIGVAGDFFDAEGLEDVHREADWQVIASEANDDLDLTFEQIAAAVQKRYLEEVPANDTATE
jgi:hypothetical protein